MYHTNHWQNIYLLFRYCKLRRSHLLFAAISCLKISIFLISSWLDSTSTTEMVDAGSIPGQTKPYQSNQRLLKLSFTAAFLLDIQYRKGQWEASIVRNWQVSRWQFHSVQRKIFSLSSGQDNLVNRHVIKICAAVKIKLKYELFCSPVLPQNYIICCNF